MKLFSVPWIVLSLATASQASSDKDGELGCKAGRAMVPGYQTAIKGFDDGKWILLAMVEASGRNPEGFIFYDCEENKLSERCPNLFGDGVVIPTEDLVHGTTGRWSTIVAYSEVFAVLGALVGINSAKPTTIGVSGLSAIVPLSPLEKFRRAKFAHDIVVGAFRHACAHLINLKKHPKNEKKDQLGSEPVLRPFDDMKTDLILMGTNILHHMGVDKDAKPGTEAYAVAMSINDKVNEAHARTLADEAKEDACKADPSKCDGAKKKDAREKKDDGEKKDAEKKDD